MLFKTLIVICLTIVGVICQQQDSTCDRAGFDTIRQCYNTYLRFYNLTVSSTGQLPLYTQFVNATLEYDQVNGVNGLGSSCQNQQRLTSCIGNFEPCIDATDMFQIFNNEQTDLSIYEINYYTFKYMCGAGRQYYTSDYSCLSSDAALEKSQFTNCGNILLSDNDDSCNTVGSFVSCLTNIGTNACGRNAGAFFCNVAKSMFTTIISSTCSLPVCDVISIGSSTTQNPRSTSGQTTQFFNNTTRRVFTQTPLPLFNDNGASNSMNGFISLTMAIFAATLIF
uniref:Transmembrane protein n=1 Tax=Rhabditophanes sp. KR3021 TaxID=114890 RepID=A0AC35U994_9BILA